MKLTDLKKGMRILVPCPTCPEKRSIVFHSAPEYRATKARPCWSCQAEDAGEPLYTLSPAFRLAYLPEMRPLDEVPC